MFFFHELGMKISRHKRRLLCCAAVLALLEGEEAAATNPFRGRLLGSHHIRRTRREVDDMFHQLGNKAQRAFKASLEQFNTIHDILEPQ